MNNNLFGLPENATDRFMREERERAKLAREALGSSFVQQAIKEAQQHRKLLADLDWARTVQTAREVARSTLEQRQSLQHLASAGWASSLQETARDIAFQQQDFFEQQRRLGSSVVETIKAFQAHRPLIESVVEIASFAESHRSLIEQLVPSMQLYGAIAERMRLIESMALRASVEVEVSTAALVAEKVIEAQHIAQAMAETDIADEGAQLFRRLLDVLLGIIDRFGANTVHDFEKMGLTGLLGLVSAILAFEVLLPQPAIQSPEDKAAFVELNRKLNRLQADAQRYHAATIERDRAFLAGLKRAQLSRSRMLRRHPHRHGDVVLKAEPGLEVAIERVEGRWRLVLFRDPLSGQLLRAWVYVTALTPLSDPAD